MKPRLTWVPTVFPASDDAPRRCLDHVTKKAEQFLVRDGDCAPAAFFLAKTGDPERLTMGIVPLGDFFDGPESRELLSRLMPVFLREQEAFAVVVVFEAWVADVGPADAPPPSEHPDRREVVQVQLEMVGERTGGRSYPILRDADGKPTGFGEPAELGATRGRFSDWLPAGGVN